MDAKKYQKIKDFLSFWNYTPEHLAEYLKSVAPHMAPSAARAETARSNEFWREFIGQAAKSSPQKTPIPRPEDTSKRSLAADAYLLLGLGDDPICVEDLADFLEHREIKSKDLHAAESKDKQMFMSNMLRAMNADEDDQRRKELEASFANSERLRNQKVDMNDLLRNAPGECDSTPKNIRLPDVRHDSNGKNDPFNTMLRHGVDPQNRA